jgi:hypothetical protein
MRFNEVIEPFMKKDNDCLYILSYWEYDNMYNNDTNLFNSLMRMIEKYGRTINISNIDIYVMKILLSNDDHDNENIQQLLSSQLNDDDKKNLIDYVRAKEEMNIYM